MGLKRQYSSDERRARIAGIARGLAFFMLVLLSGPTLAVQPVGAISAHPCRRTEPVREAGFVEIGGIQQWVTIRGDSCANPVILFLHGGPGNPLSPFSERIYAAWESEFTLVQWDQRGAGRTFSRNPQADLTIARMTSDGIALTEYLRVHLGQSKIILLAGSWGTVLGVHMAMARPDLFHAYVGAGQLVNYRENQMASYSRLLEIARAAGDSATVQTIEALGPPPWTNPRNAGALRRASRTYERRSTIPPPQDWWTPATAYADAESLATLEAGDDFSYLQFVGQYGNGMASGIDLPSLGMTFGMPVFILAGAEDLVTMPALARAYFENIVAPQKEFRVLEATGHDPNQTLIDSQLEVLRTRIRPGILSPSPR